MITPEQFERLSNLYRRGNLEKTGCHFTGTVRLIGQHIYIVKQSGEYVANFSKREFEHLVASMLGIKMK